MSESSLPNQISGSCHFCDDVRFEGNGKAIHIGIYGADIFLPSLPYVLERIYCMITLRAPIDHPRPRAITVRIEIPGQPDVSVPMPPVTDESQLNLADGIRAWDLRLTAPFKMTCTEQGRVRVYCDTDQGSVFVGGIRIGPATEALGGQSAAGIQSAIVHFVRRMEPESAADKKQLADGLYRVLEDLLLPSITKFPAPPGILFAAKSPQEFYIFYPEPRSKRPALRITHQGRPIKFKRDKGNKYYTQVTLTDAEGPNFNDGLSVEIEPLPGKDL